ncbi:hypothetical protein ACXIUT_25905 [Achromobacter denitrificans]
MTLHRPGLFIAAVLALAAWAAPRADAACSDAKIQAMAKDGRSVKAIAKACNMPSSKVRGAVEGDGDKAPARPGRSERSEPAAPVRKAGPAPKAESAEAGKLPSGSGLVRCDCQGSVPYGDKAPEQRCQSGTSIATPCAGYCPPAGIAPWRRICS